MTTNHAKSWMLCVAVLLPVVTGCAAFRPVKGVPARYVPDEFRGPTRSGKRTIDLSLLRQPPTSTHLVDSGDLLSIYVEGVLGKREEQPPVYYPAQDSDIAPTVGFPLPVRDDGTISLPLVGPLTVRGLSLVEVENRIRHAYTVNKEILKAGQDRIFVALQRPRTHRILVIRQEASSDVSVSAQGTLNIGALKRGTGKVVNLPVYKNDVLNALAETGGLPGLDAENALYIIRSNDRGLVPGQQRPLYQQQTTQREVMQTVIRAQSPGWGAPSASIDPHGDYRRASGPGWSSPSGSPTSTPGGFGGPQLNPVPDPLAVAPTPPAGNWSQPQSAMMASPPSNGMPASRQWSAPSLPPEPMGPAGVMPSYPSTPHYSMPPMIAPPPPSDVMDPLSLPLAGVDVGDSLEGRHIVRIPVRLDPDENADIRPQDVILEDGDILFIESRDTEVFYTGGLLGGGQFSLPRDYDLDVLGAIAVASGRNVGGGGGGSQGTTSVGGSSALNGDVSISASQVIVLRPLPDGTQIPIHVDLYQALRDPTERTIIQPGDYILLQYTPMEAIGAFIERHLLAGALFSVASAQFNGGGN